MLSGAPAMGAGMAPRRMVLPTAKSMGSRPRQSRGTSMLWSSTYRPGTWYEVMSAM